MSESFEDVCDMLAEDLACCRQSDKSGTNTPPDGVWDADPSPASSFSANSSPLLDFLNESADFVDFSFFADPLAFTGPPAGQTRSYVDPSATALLADSSAVTWPADGLSAGNVFQRILQNGAHVDTSAQCVQPSDLYRQDFGQQADCGLSPAFDADKSAQYTDPEASWLSAGFDQIRAFNAGTLAATAIPADSWPHADSGLITAPVAGSSAPAALTAGISAHAGIVGSTMRHDVSTADPTPLKMRNHFPQFTSAVARIYSTTADALGSIQDGFSHPLNRALSRGAYPTRAQTQLAFDQKWTGLSGSGKFRDRDHLFASSQHLTETAPKVKELQDKDAEHHPRLVKNDDLGMTAMQKHNLVHKWRYDEHGHLLKKRTLKSNKALTDEGRQAQKAKRDARPAPHSVGNAGNADVHVSNPSSSSLDSTTTAATTITPKEPPSKRARMAGNDIISAPAPGMPTTPEKMPAMPPKPKKASPDATLEYLIAAEHAHALLLWAHSPSDGKRHSGRDRTFERIKEYFSTECFTKDIVNSWIQHCPTCNPNGPKTSCKGKASTKRKRDADDEAN